MVSMKKGNKIARFFFFLWFSLFNVFTPMTMLSCSKKHNNDLLDESFTGKNFFDEIITNTSYYFSFNKDDYSISSSFNSKNNYSIQLKCQKNEIEEFQKQQKIFLKLKCLAKFYSEKIGIIFCLPLITKIDGNK